MAENIKIDAAAVSAAVSSARSTFQMEITSAAAAIKTAADGMDKAHGDTFEAIKDQLAEEANVMKKLGNVGSALVNGLVQASASFQQLDSRMSGNLGRKNSR